MSEKRYFKIEYDEEWYLFDSSKISEQLVKKQAEYGYGVFANSLSPSEICDLLNSLNDENEQLLEEMIDIIYSEFNECFLELDRQGMTLTERLFFQEIKNKMFDRIDYRIKFMTQKESNSDE